MKRAYKYKIKPTVRQQRMLSQFFGCVRFIYNWGLDRKVKAYKESKTNVTYIQLAKELTLLKQENEHKWLNDCSKSNLTALMNLHTSFAFFFDLNLGNPFLFLKKLV